MAEAEPDEGLTDPADERRDRDTADDAEVIAGLVMALAVFVLLGLLRNRTRRS